MYINNYIEQARKGDNRFLVYVLGLFVVFVAVVLCSILVSGLIYGLGGEMSDTSSINPDALGLHPAMGLFLLVLPFPAGILGLWIAMKGFHKRAFVTLISAINRIDWNKFLFAAGLWMVLGTAFELVAFGLEPENYSLTFDPAKFFPTLLVTLIIIPLQASMEELIFRGYLLQGLGTATKRGWIAILLTAIGFGLLHGANPEIAEFGPLMFLYYIGFGVIMGVMTWMDEGLELALGVHAANNVYGTALVTFPSSALQTPALFTMGEYDVQLMTIGWIIISAIFVYVVARKYKWGNWNKLFEKLVPAPSALDELVGEIGVQPDPSTADSQ